MQSRNEGILQAIINGDDFSDLPVPQSRIEALLIRLGEIIEQGGGGASGYTIWVGTASEYAALGPNYDSKTLYFVKE